MLGEAHERYRECIDIAFIDRINNQPPGEERTVDELARGFWCDVSVGVQMKKWGDAMESLQRGSLFACVSPWCAAYVRF